jgi:hypothetical protein
MATQTVPASSTKSTTETSKAASADKTYTSEYLTNREKLLEEVMIEGEKRIHRSFAKAIALGIIDKNGKRIKKELPADMLPGSDCDFGG